MERGEREGREKEREREGGVIKSYENDSLILLDIFQENLIIALFNTFVESFLISTSKIVLDLLIINNDN